MATTCCAPRPAVRGQESRSSGRTTAPGAGVRPSPCRDQRTPRFIFHFLEKGTIAPHAKRSRGVPRMEQPTPSELHSSEPLGSATPGCAGLLPPPLFARLRHVRLHRAASPPASLCSASPSGSAAPLALLGFAVPSPSLGGWAAQRAGRAGKEANVPPHPPSPIAASRLALAGPGAGSVGGRRSAVPTLPQALNSANAPFEQGVPPSPLGGPIAHSRRAAERRPGWTTAVGGGGGLPAGPQPWSRGQRPAGPQPGSGGAAATAATRLRGVRSRPW
jgi:hypothetical protein